MFLGKTCIRIIVRLRTVNSPMDSELIFNKSNSKETNLNSLAFLMVEYEKLEQTKWIKVGFSNNKV